MSNYTYSRNQLIKQFMLIPLVLVVFLAMISSSCRPTVFPPAPSPHPLVNELEKWPDEYYWMVETGVSSRIMGMQFEGSIDENLRRIEGLLSEIKTQWNSIGKLQTTDELVIYFNEHDLEPIAEAVEKTLLANEDRKPADFNSQLQALSIKRGIQDAYNKVKEETSR